jgi:hypothetical protein
MCPSFVVGAGAVMTHISGVSNSDRFDRDFDFIRSKFYCRPIIMKLIIHILYIDKHVSTI